MIPLYIVIASFGLVNTHTALIVTTMINITYIFMMRQFFIHFPREIEEAAAMDGLSRIRHIFPHCVTEYEGIDCYPVCVRVYGGVE